MDMAVQHMPIEAKNAVEIILHIKEDLGEEQRQALVSAMEGANGIMAAEFCPLRYHLIVASYDRDAVSSLDVLKSVNSLNVEAKLIGPI
jgi:phosphoribosyl-ATP pyrophosphohydrolase